MSFRQKLFSIGLIAIAWIALDCWQTAQAIPTNLAPAGTATQSTTLNNNTATYGAERGNNGNRAGNDIIHTWNPANWNDPNYGGGQTPTPQWWEVDLGADYYLDRVQILPRSLNQGTIENFTISVKNALGNTVFSEVYLPNTATDRNLDGTAYVGYSAWGTTDVRNVVGRTVRFERNDTDPLPITFSEFEVYGQSTPITGTNLALNRPVVATPEQATSGGQPAVEPFYAWRANDGNIDPNLHHYSVYHSLNTVTPFTGHFWQVELEHPSSVDYVRIFARHDYRLNNGYVDLKLLAADGVTVVDTTTIFLGESDLGAGRYDYTHEFSGSPIAKYVRIESVSENVLNLAEVEVFGTSTVTSVPGDFDGDGDVDGTDFVAWQTNFPKASNALLSEGDADGDGDVDGADFVVWQTNFPYSPSSGTAPVPEPLSGWLLAIGGVVCLTVRRARRRLQ